MEFSCRASFLRTGSISNRNITKHFAFPRIDVGLGQIREISLSGLCLIGSNLVGSSIISKECGPR